MNHWYVMIGLGAGTFLLGYFFLVRSFTIDTAGVSWLQTQWFPVLGFVCFFLAGILLLLGVAMLLSRLTSKTYASSPSLYMTCVAGAAILTALIAAGYVRAL